MTDRPSQDAKNRFSAHDDYERLRQVESSTPPSLGELLLEMPQDDGEFERLPVAPRDVEF